MAHASSVRFGLGLRAAHYEDFLQSPQPVDWLEIISDDYLGDAGHALATLDAIRSRYPMAMHGAALSIGSPAGPDPAYLRQLARLARRMQPMWISDHLCWTGVHGRHFHDLLPVPYTEEALAVVVRNLQQVQDALGGPILLENVLSHAASAGSRLPESRFLREVALQSGCLILLNLNNVHLGAMHRGTNPLDYLADIPADRVRQIHLSGHADRGSCAVDTAGHAGPDAVWPLYRAALERFGPVATMIKRDDGVPPLAELLDELDRARRIAAIACPPADAGCMSA